MQVHISYIENPPVEEYKYSFSTTISDTITINGKIYYVIDDLRTSNAGQVYLREDMATQTTHYNLTKPDLTDLVDVTVLNDNADIIDQAIYEASQSGGAAMIESSVEATTTSAHAYAVGDHFIYNNTLYAVTAAIAVGDTITPGTNCTATNLAAALNAINS